MSLRLEPELARRVEALVRAMLERTDYKGLGLTRASVLRLALFEGLLVLEQRLGLPSAGKHRGKRP